LYFVIRTDTADSPSAAMPQWISLLRGRAEMIALTEYIG
jgi:hypothetical protein